MVDRFAFKVIALRRLYTNILLVFWHLTFAGHGYAAPQGPTVGGHYQGVPLEPFRPAAVVVRMELPSESEPEKSVLVDTITVTNAEEMKAAAEFFAEEVKDALKANPDAEIVGIEAYPSPELRYTLAPGNEQAAEEIARGGEELVKTGKGELTEIYPAVYGGETKVGRIVGRVVGKTRPVYRISFPPILSPQAGAGSAALVSTAEPSAPVGLADAPPVLGTTGGEDSSLHVAPEYQLTTGDRTLVWVRTTVAGVVQFGLILAATGHVPTSAFPFYKEAYSQLSPEAVARLADISTPLIAAFLAVPIMHDFVFQYHSKRYRQWLQRAKTSYGVFGRRLALSATLLVATQTLAVQANLIPFDLLHSMYLAPLGVMSTHGLYLLYAKDKVSAYLKSPIANFSLAMLGTLGIVIGGIENTFNIRAGSIYMIGLTATSTAVYLGTVGVQEIIDDTKTVLGKLRDMFGGAASLCKQTWHKARAQTIEFGRRLGGAHQTTTETKR